MRFAALFYKETESDSPIENVDQDEASKPPCWRVQLLSRRLLGKKRAFVVVVVFCPAERQKVATVHGEVFCCHYLMA